MTPPVTPRPLSLANQRERVITAEMSGIQRAREGKTSLWIANDPADHILKCRIAAQRLKQVADSGMSHESSCRRGLTIPAKRFYFYFNVRSAVCRIMVAMKRKETQEIAFGVCDSPYSLRDAKAVDTLAVRSAARSACRTGWPS